MASTWTSTSPAKPKNSISMPIIKSWKNFFWKPTQPKHKASENSDLKETMPIKITPILPNKVLKINSRAAKDLTTGVRAQLPEIPEMN